MVLGVKVIVVFAAGWMNVSTPTVAALGTASLGIQEIDV